MTHIFFEPSAAERAGGAVVRPTPRAPLPGPAEPVVGVPTAPTSAWHRFWARHSDTRAPAVSGWDLMWMAGTLGWHPPTSGS